MMKKMAENKTIYLSILSCLLFGIGITILLLSTFLYLAFGDAINMVLLLTSGIACIIGGIIVAREIVKDK